MVQHCAVPTTCTASLVTGWDYSHINSTDAKLQVNARLKFVGELKKAGYKEDFAIIHAFTTGQQVTNNGLEEIMPRLGFEKVFHGSKKDDTKKQRHQETGDLFLWAVKPSVYKEALEGWEKELTELKEKIDPPKKPDPKRLAYPDIRGLVSAGIFAENSKMDNPIEQLLLVPQKKAEMHIKMKFGIDVQKWNNQGDNWVKMTPRQLRDAQKRWKEELF